MPPETVPPTMDVTEALARARTLHDRPGRVLLGITGPPGAGKSTLAASIVEAIGPSAVVVPMDGFHLADAALDALGLRAWKGRIDTFDGHGYLALLRRLRDETGNTVYAPTFERDLEQPIAGAIAVTPTARLVVTDGNSLLDEAAPWDEVAEVLDEVWYVDLDDTERRRRLSDRHVRFGKSPDQASEWIERVDAPNARRIATTREHASAVVTL